MSGDTAYTDPEIVERAHPGLDARVRAFGAGEEVDAFVVHGSRLDVGVDTLSTPNMARALIEAAGLDPRGRPLLVVNTHADWDHAWGNSAFDDLVPSPAIVGHRAARARLVGPEADGELRRLRERFGANRFAGLRLVAPTLTVEGEAEIDCGDLTIRLLLTSGHTPDHYVLWIPELSTLLAGDAVERPLPELWDEFSLPAMRRSLRRLAALDADVVLPSHGATADPDVVTENVAYFDRLDATVAEHLGGPGGPVRDPAEVAGRLDFPLDTVLRGAGRPLNGEQEAFYRECHDLNVLATIGERLRQV